MLEEASCHVVSGPGEKPAGHGKEPREALSPEACEEMKLSYHERDLGSGSFGPSQVLR